MKRLVFAKPVTRRLTPGSSGYTNPNTNPSRPSRHLTWPGGRSPGVNYRGEISGADHRGNYPGSSPGEITGEFTCFRNIY